jgi:hypothetical protein
MVLIYHLIIYYAFYFYPTFAPDAAVQRSEATMLRIDNSLNIIVLAMVLAVSFAAVGAAQPAEAKPVQWLTAETSIPAAQSTAALIQGHPARATAMAARALDRAQGYDRVVALHNLCVALLRQDQATRAAPACEEAMKIAAASPQRINGRSVSDIVLSNIGRERSGQINLARSGN